MSIIKNLVIGDLHFQDNGDIQFFQRFIDEVENILKQGEHENVILLGDIKHKFRKDDRDTQTLVYNLFTMITKYSNLYVLVGNHDMDDSLQFLTEKHTLLAYKKWPRVTIVDKPIRVMLGKTSAVFCPYVPKGRFIEALDTLVESGSNWNDADVIFAHQEFAGGKMGGTISVDGDQWSEDYPLVISGHLHGKHKVGTNIVYPGTPYDLGWDESEKRVVLELVLGCKFRLNYIQLSLPKKILLKLGFKEAMEWEMPEDSIDYYKLKICCTKSEFKTFTKERKELKKLVKIVHVSSDEKKMSEFLASRKLIGHNDYSSILRQLVEQEDEVVQGIYNKILI